MPLKITQGYQQLVAQAEKKIEIISIQDALALHGSEDVVFVDLGDVRELWRSALAAQVSQQMGLARRTAALPGGVVV